jgi:hypothetical protein
VGVWLSLNVVIVAVVLSMLWFERGKPTSTRPGYVGLALLTATTAFSYWLEQDMYIL